jgi:CheY-like chemotaxis protein
MSRSSRGDTGEGQGREVPAAIRVLCVDDEPATLAMLARTLAPQFDVVTSHSPIEALSLLESDGNFAVVIADVSMPQMNGLAFLRQVQSFSPTTTRLVLSGNFIVDPLAIPAEAVFRLIAKPCPGDKLREIVLDAANYHRLIASSPVQPVERRYDTPVAVSRPKAPASARRAADPSQRGQFLEPHSGGQASPVVIHEEEAAPARPLMIAARVGLRLGGRTVELLPGLTIVGRSRTCHIPIDDATVSRRHACFSHAPQGLTVRNLSSTNRLLLNDTIVAGDAPHPLRVGDRVSIGSNQVEVCTFGDYLPSLEPTQRLSAWSDADLGAETEPVTLAELSAVATRYVQLGQGRDIERILRPALEGLLRHSQAGKNPLLSDVKLAVDWALTIAEQGRSGEWISYSFNLLGVLGQPAEQGIVERLYRLVPATPGISMASYRSYLEALVPVQNQFGPGQRFLIRRLQGLESAMMMSAHI